MVEIISSSCQAFDGVRYYRCGRYFQRKGVRLHRVVWLQLRGAIPDGFHVHHIDGDPANNQPGNLQLIEARAHLRHHGPESGQRGVDALPAARAAAAAWHGSEDGKKWHREQYERHCADVLHARELMLCAHCGGVFDGLTKRQKFCSNACKSAARRAAGADNVQRVCPACGVWFSVGRYAATKTCSATCGAVLAKAARAARRAGGAG